MSDTDDKTRSASTSASSTYSLSDLIALNAEIAALAKARLPLESQLRRLGRELPRKSGWLATQIGARLEAGQSLHAAVEAEGDRLPRVYRAVVAAGLKSGRLSAALEALSDSARRLEQLRRITGLALIYPLLIVVVTWALLVPAVWWIIPKFAWFEEGGTGPFTRGLEVSQTASIVATAVATVVLAVFVVWWWRSAAARSQDDGAVDARSWLPWFGQVRYCGYVATFADILRLMVEHGVPLDDALVTAADATPDGRLREAARKLASGIAAGTAVNDEQNLPYLDLCPPHVALALRQAADRRLMVSGLDQAASIYRGRAERSAYWATEYLPLLFTAGIGGIAATALTFVVLWPYVSMLRELSGAF